MVRRVQRRSHGRRLYGCDALLARRIRDGRRGDAPPALVRRGSEHLDDQAAEPSSFFDPGNPPLVLTPRRKKELDPSGLPDVPVGGPAVHPMHAASGVGFGTSRVAQQHRSVPDGWLPAMKYFVEELGLDPNIRDADGYTPIHHSAARGDNETIIYLVEQGADVTLISRRGQTSADMANSPEQRAQPHPATIALLEKLGSHNNHNCQSCGSGGNQ